MYESNQRGAGELLNPAFDPADHAHHGPERVVMQTEMEQCLADAVTRLPLSLRRAIVLTTLNDFSPQEVAEMEACSVNTIYSRIHEARKLLRKQLEPWFP